MAATAAASGSEQAAAPEPTPNPAPACPRASLDPRLLMAARRGDSMRIKELLFGLDTEEVESHAGNNAGTHGVGVVESAAASAGAVILEVAPDGPPAAPATPPLVVDGDGVTLEGDTLLHVVAACGDINDFIACAKLIVRDKERKGGAAAVCLALEARNNKGDTPLHYAAAAGNANMISCLVHLELDNAADEAAAAVKAFLRMQNNCGETALHQAVRAANDNKEVCIGKLMAVDPELACIPHEDGASPLYVAISLGEREIARRLYVKSKGKLSYSGPDGRNVLHAAVSRGQALPMILGWLQDMQLISRLTSQRDNKQKGSTPLHLAASLDGWPSAWFLSTRFPQVWPSGESMAKLLLDANESTAYQADDQGSYPIHVAAACNSLGVVRLLLERCPDCATLRDGKGRTFLHVATETGLFSSPQGEGAIQTRLKHHAVVEYVCREMPQRSSSMILNAQDSNGDTALHYSVRAGNLAVFNCLLPNRQVRLDVANKDGMTPLDLSWTMLPAGLYHGFNPRSIVCSSLLEAGAPHGGGRPDNLFTKKQTELDEEQKKYAEATQAMSIVTALIATVTFASTFTLPGGYRSADDAAGAAGTPVLAGSYAFDAFILADTLAFICSMAATYCLYYVGVPAVDISIRYRYFIISLRLMKSAARSLVAAFGLGLCLVVHHTAQTASVIAACAIIFASLLFGLMEVWQIFSMARIVFARIRIRQYALVHFYPRWIACNVLTHFWSYILIFGLPAICKRVH